MLNDTALDDTSTVKIYDWEAPALDDPTVPDDDRLVDFAGADDDDYPVD